MTNSQTSERQRDRSLWERILQLKIYLVGGILFIIGAISIAASLWPSLSHQSAEYLKDAGFHVSTAGLVVLVVEYMLRRESDEFVRNTIENTLRDAAVWGQIPDEATIYKASEQGVLAAINRGTVVAEQPTMEIIRAVENAQEEILIFGLSLRNILQEEVRKKIKHKLLQSRVKIRILMIAPGSRFVQWRERMWWQERGNMTVLYRSEINIKLTELRDLITSNEGPGTIEARTYDLMPSCYFVAVDGQVFASFYLVNRSIGSSPFILLNAATHPTPVGILRENFENVWVHERTHDISTLPAHDPSPRKFVVVAAADRRGVVFVHNLRRKWELPAGYIEPNESGSEAARREFFEETGMDLDVKDVISRDNSYLVYGIAGKQTSAPREGEIGEVRYHTACPPVPELSFYEPEDLLIIETALSFYRQQLHAGMI